MEVRGSCKGIGQVMPSSSEANNGYPTVARHRLNFKKRPRHLHFKDFGEKGEGLKVGQRPRTLALKPLSI